MSLCHDKHDADDLLQETMLKAWNNLESFKEGTNLRAWLFTIMRNTHFSHYRKKRTQLIDEGTEALAQIGVPPTQIDFRRCPAHRGRAPAIEHRATRGDHPGRR